MSHDTVASTYFRDYQDLLPLPPRHRAGSGLAVSRWETGTPRTLLCQTTYLDCHGPSGPAPCQPCGPAAAGRCGWSRCSRCQPAAPDASHWAKRKEGEQLLSDPPREMHLNEPYLICCHLTVVHGHGERWVEAPRSRCLFFLERSVLNRNKTVI